jgi:hypothetical protein
MTSICNAIKLNRPRIRNFTPDQEFALIRPCLFMHAIACPTPSSARMISPNAAARWRMS